ncbi:MAG: hypothetical protein LBJ13_04250 [Puniceicoccales bacterium]|jgi:uncharacterized protein (DUF697 family)|nr:hypothetical protein [Puniceicoccales bacterium]
MTDNEKSKCHAIIHSASVAAGAAGAGLAQIPGSDNAVITPIQVGMILGLSRIFGKSLTEGAALSFLAETVATMLGRTVARTITQLLIGWIPGIGNTVNATTAAGFTEAMGWVVANQFDEERKKQEA